MSEQGFVGSQKRMTLETETGQLGGRESYRRHVLPELISRSEKIRKSQCFPAYPIVLNGEGMTSASYL